MNGLEQTDPYAQIIPQIISGETPSPLPKTPGFSEIKHEAIDPYIRAVADVSKSATSPQNRLQAPEPASGDRTAVQVGKEPTEPESKPQRMPVASDESLYDQWNRILRVGPYEGIESANAHAKPGPYVTTLAPADEQKFQQWVKANHVPWRDEPNADYDMRGFYKALMAGDPDAKQALSAFDRRMHFPDTYKTPYHKTFSNESKYALPSAPHWVGEKLVDEGGNVITDETPAPTTRGQIVARLNKLNKVVESLAPHGRLLGELSATVLDKKIKPEYLDLVTKLRRMGPSPTAHTIEAPPDLTDWMAPKVGPSVTSRPATPEEEEGALPDVSGKLQPKQKSEDELWGAWHQARNIGDFGGQIDAAKNYLQMYPNGQYASWMQETLNHFSETRTYSSTRKGMQVTDAEGNVVSNRGAYATFPVAQIEGLRKAGYSDDQILKEIQDNAGRQMGLSDTEMAALTEKYGQHPLGNLVEPGTSTKSSVDSIIRQGQGHGGLAEFNIDPETVSALLRDRQLYRPLATQTEEMARGLHFTGDDFLNSVIKDPKITPDIKAAAALLQNSPDAKRLLDTTAGGVLDSAARLAQTVHNIGDYLDHPVGKANQFFSDLLTGGALSEKYAKKGKVYGQISRSDLADRLSDEAENVAGKYGVGKDAQSSAAIRHGAKLIANMFPIVLSAQMGGITGLGSYGFFEGAQKGPGSAAMTALAAAGPYAIVTKSPLAGYLREALVGRLTPSREMIQAALSAGTEEEAIDTAARAIQAKVMAQVVGMTAERALRAGTFLATAEAINGARQGRLMNAKEIEETVAQMIALEAIPAVRAALEIPGAGGEVRDLLGDVLARERAGQMRNVTPRGPVEPAPEEARTPVGEIPSAGQTWGGLRGNRFLRGGQAQLGEGEPPQEPTPPKGPRGLAPGPAAPKQLGPAPEGGITDAEEIRSDEGQIYRGGRIRAGSEGEGGADIQRAEEARRGASRPAQRTEAQAPNVIEREPEAPSRHVEIRPEEEPARVAVKDRPAPIEIVVGDQVTHPALNRGQPMTVVAANEDSVKVEIPGKTKPITIATDSKVGRELKPVEEEAKGGPRIEEAAKRPEVEPGAAERPVGVAAVQEPPERKRKAEAQALEPWQQTRAEYRAAQNREKVLAITSALQVGRPITLTTQYRRDPLTSPEHIRMTPSAGVQIRQATKWVNLTGPQVDQLAGQAGMKIPPPSEAPMHSELVKQAVARGEKVPESVLAEYPRSQKAARLLGMLAEPEAPLTTDLSLPSGRVSSREAQSSNMALAGWDPSGHYLFVNPKGLGMLSELAGHNITGVTMDSPAAYQYAAKATAKARRSTGEEAENYHALARALYEGASSKFEFAVGRPHPTTYKHELTHVADYAVRRYYGKEIPVGAALEIPSYQKVAKAVKKRGYAWLSDPRLVVHEAAAHIAAGQEQELGMSEDDALDFMDGYFNMIGRAFAPDALNRFHHLDGKLKEVKDEVKAKLEQDRAPEKGRAVAGRPGLRTVAKGRERGAQGVSQEAESLAPLSAQQLDALKDLVQTLIDEDVADPAEIEKEVESLLGPEGHGKIKDALPMIVGEMTAPEPKEEPSGKPEKITEAPEAEPTETTLKPKLSETREPGGPRSIGEATQIVIPGTNKTINARYAIRELADVFPSHDPLTFQPNPAYQWVNDRHYDREKFYQQEVMTQSSPDKFLPKRLINNSDTAENGPPIIDMNGNVLGGNSRSMMLGRFYRAEGAGQPYKAELYKQAPIYGIALPEIVKMKQPILVREVTDENLVPHQAITELNVSGTRALTPQERAVAEAGQMKDATVNYLAGQIESGGPEATLSKVLEAKGPAIVEHLIQSGVFQPQERNALLKAGGILPEARQRIERLLLGRIFRDLDQMGRTPSYVRQNIERAAPSLIKLQADPEWDLTEEIRNAIDLITDAKAAGVGKDLEGYTKKEGSLFVEKPFTAREIQLGNALQMGPIKTAKAFRTYAEAREPGGLFAQAVTPTDAFIQAFGGKPEEVETPGMFSLAKLPALTKRVDNMSDSERQTLLKQIDDEIARQAFEGAKVAANCIEHGGRFSILP